MLKSHSHKSYITKMNNTDSSVQDFISLLKPRVMALAIFTSICGLILAQKDIHPFFFLLSILCISLGAGASGAINMWYDRDIDALMDRTKGRPIPKGKVNGFDALGFGIILSLVAVVLLGLAVNYFAAFLLACSISFYIFIYTIWLKRKTPQNIVIGGAAGAFPPMIGWACATGSLTLYPVILFTIIFVWTPPHFWALSLYKDIEYSKAKVPMLPVVSGKQYTTKQILIYSILLFFITLLPYYFEFSGQIYLASAIILNVYFLYLAYGLFKCSENNYIIFASKLFKYSILYLYLIFLTLVLDSILI